MMPAPSVRALDVPPSELGEGPLWHATERMLFWIDIRASLLHRWHSDDGYAGAIALPAAPGCLVNGPRETIVAATAAGLIAIDPGSGSITPLGAAPPEGGRYNDGAVDPSGRLWVGTVESAPGAHDGVLCEIGPELIPAIRRRGLAVPNGIDYSPDHRTMYFTVTELGRILAIERDSPSGGSPRPPRERVLSQDAGCSPDGLVVDLDGMIWSAKWSGAKIVQLAPDGSLLREVPLPVTNITSAAFGGADLATLFVTTAADEPGAPSSERPEWAGRVLAIDGLGARGSSLPFFDFPDHGGTP